MPAQTARQLSGDRIAEEVGKETAGVIDEEFKKMLGLEARLKPEDEQKIIDAVKELAEDSINNVAADEAKKMAEENIEDKIKNFGEDEVDTADIGEEDLEGDSPEAILPKNWQERNPKELAQELLNAPDETPKKPQDETQQNQTPQGQKEDSKQLVPGQQTEEKKHPQDTAETEELQAAPKSAIPQDQEPQNQEEDDTQETSTQPDATQPEAEKPSTEGESQPPQTEPEETQNVPPDQSSQNQGQEGGPMAPEQQAEEQNQPTDKNPDANQQEQQKKPQQEQEEEPTPEDSGEEEKKQAEEEQKKQSKLQKLIQKIKDTSEKIKAELNEKIDSLQNELNKHKKRKDELDSEKKGLYKKIALATIIYIAKNILGGIICLVGFLLIIIPPLGMSIISYGVNFIVSSGLNYDLTMAEYAIKLAKVNGELSTIEKTMKPLQEKIMTEQKKANSRLYFLNKMIDELLPKRYENPS